jgi:hypothetical protein
LNQFYPFPQILNLFHNCEVSTHRGRSECQRIVETLTLN